MIWSTKKSNMILDLYLANPSLTPLPRLCFYYYHFPHARAFGSSRGADILNRCRGKQDRRRLLPSQPLPGLTAGLVNFVVGIDSKLVLFTAAAV